MSSLGRPTGFRTDMAGSQIAGRSHPKHSQERGAETVAMGNAADHTHELHGSTNTSFVNRGRLSLPIPDISGSRPRKYQRGPSDHIPLEIEAELAALVIWSTGPRLSKKATFPTASPQTDTPWKVHCFNRRRQRIAAAKLGCSGNLSVPRTIEAHWGPAPAGHGSCQVVPRTGRPVFLPPVRGPVCSVPGSRREHA